MRATIADVRSWWGGHISGEADAVGDRFVYAYEDLHRSTQEVTELSEHRIVWHVTDSDLSFTAARNEWDGTDVVFELAPGDGGTRVTMTQDGLTPDKECFEQCSAGWAYYAGGALRRKLEEVE